MCVQLKKIGAIIALSFIYSIFSSAAYAEKRDIETDTSIDRIQLVTQQVNLLKNRFTQAEHELAELQKQNDNQISQLALEKASKNLLDKAGLDISVAKTNLDSINIELADSQQSVVWIEKNIQELENQLNVLGIFGLKVSEGEKANIQQYRIDLVYQKQLLQMEKTRAKYLLNLQTDAVSILQLKKEKHSRLSELLKTRKLLHIKQQQVKDELAYQEQQNEWLQKLNSLYTQIAKVDPSKDRSTYASLERDIFYTNENANYAYVQSLLARYKDQIQQMKIVVSRSNSISLLNEVGDQEQTLAKQVNRLDKVLRARTGVLQHHISYLSKKKYNADELQLYIAKLSGLVTQYKKSTAVLAKLNDGLTELRDVLAQALKVELSARQGFPTFGLKMMIDLGKEMLLVPALTFQVVKSLSTNFTRSFYSATAITWIVFAFTQFLFVSASILLRRFLQRSLAKTSEQRELLTSKWLSMQWLRRNVVDLLLFGNMLALMSIFGIPLQNYEFLVSLFLVWLLFKCILTVARLCLMETTDNISGHDVRLFLRLKWIIIIGGLVTALTVFIHQLPLIYELKMLCDRLFLCFLMIVSILLLRSWDVVPNLILTHMESRHPYVQRSVKLVVGILIPILMFGNSVIGMFGYVNLVMTVSWYEGIFLIVLVGYLVMRGLLSDGIEQLSLLVIRYANNGWLWNEAFLKPLDKVMRIALFLTSWSVLFILYGWDKQSPIVERINRLLHYKLASVLNTSITPINIIELVVVSSVFYWTAKWTREFVYRILATRTHDMGIRNSIAILSQYSVVVLGIFMGLRVLGIDLSALAFVVGMFGLGIGMGLRDLVNNFACGFLMLLERPLRVGDIVSINGVEGEVAHLGGRAVTVRTFDHMELCVPNTEIYNKTFTNWTARDNVIRSVVQIKISRHDNPHEVKVIVQNVLNSYKDILKDPAPEVFLKDMNETVMDFELRYFINIRVVKSRISVMSAVLMNIWDAFAKHGIRTPAPQHEILLKSEIEDAQLISNIRRVD